MQNAFDFFSHSEVTKPTTSFKFNPTTLEEHIRLFDNSDKDSLYQVWGWRGENKLYENIKSTDLSYWSVIDAMAELAEAGCTDLYMSPTACKGWRNADLAWVFNELHLEIDTNGHGSLDKKSADAVFAQVVSTMKRAKLPVPNHIVKSGSGGLHLYWFINPIAATKTNRTSWLKIARALTSKMSEAIPKNAKWHVDVGASVDTVRLLRLPNSIHSKSGNRVEVLTSGASRYKIEELAKLVGVKPEKRKEFQQSLQFEPKKSYTPTNNFNRYHSSIIWHLGTYARQNKVTEGQRDLVLFLSYCSMLQTMSAEKAWEQIQDLNKYVGLSDEQVETYLKAAKQKRYIYSRSGLNDALAAAKIPELPSPSRERMSPEERKQAQSDGAKNAAVVKRQKTIAKVVDVLVATANATQSMVSEATGLSLSTVKRYWKEANELANQQTREMMGKVSLGSAQYIPSPERGSEHPKDVPYRGRYFKEESLEIFDNVNIGEDELDRVQSVRGSSG
jgi:hypothetical protein